MEFKKFESLTKGEIKKINKAGNGFIGEYYSTPSEIEGFVDVECSCFDKDYEDIISKVRFVVCLFDRRRSFVSSVVM